MSEVDAAMSRVCAGRVDPDEPTAESADDLWCRIVAEGHIVEARNDGSKREDLVVRLTIVEHPALGPDRIYALYSLGLGPCTVYETDRASARLALHHPGAFNL